MIHVTELDPSKSYFSQLRSLHPIQAGSKIGDRTVVESCWIAVGDYDKPVYRLEGDLSWEYRDA